VEVIIEMIIRRVASSRDAPRPSRQNNGPRFQRPYVSPEDLLNGPCQMHFFLDNNGKRQSGHLQKDCRTFLALHRYAGHANAQAANRNPQGARSRFTSHLHPQLQMKIDISYNWRQHQPTVLISTLTGQFR
jgi:hypothetical protein